MTPARRENGESRWASELRVQAAAEVADDQEHLCRGVAGLRRGEGETEHRYNRYWSVLVRGGAWATKAVCAVVTVPLMKPRTNELSPGSKRPVERVATAWPLPDIALQNTERESHRARR